MRLAAVVALAALLALLAGPLTLARATPAAPAFAEEDPTGGCALEPRLPGYCEWWPFCGPADVYWVWRC